MNIAQSESVINVIGSTFEDINITNRCAGICSTDGSDVVIESSVFRDSSVGERAILDILTQSTLDVQNTTFENNISEQGSVLMYINDVSSANINNCTFRNNTSAGGGNPFTFIFTELVTITNSNFLSNRAIQESNHIYCIFSTMNIDN